MNIQRFYAPTAREALAQARSAFGDGTLILSNRTTANGVEVVATTEMAIRSMTSPSPMPSKAPMTDKPRRAAAPMTATQTQVEEDVAQLAMSTLSFQGYARERMLRRRHEELAKQSSAVPTRAPSQAMGESRRPLQVSAPSAPKPAPQPAKRPVASAAAPSLPQGLVNELNAVKDLIEERFNTLAWLGQSRQDPIQSNLMHKLIRAGYSPSLARAILAKLPAGTRAHGAMRWVMDILAHNLKTDADAGANPIHVEGGIYAMVGSTGVGKTTTTAKLAGLCASIHGPASVGLITLDTYRIGAHEQLRTYGRMLGVVAHLAHDGAALQDLLGLLSNKKMVLIDTSGVSPRDPRKRDMLGVLDLPGVNRLLVLNAGGHGDTLDEAVSSFRSPTGVQQAILSKLDEAAKLGPALDASIRHQLLLRGVTTGQKVPEDWEPADAAALVRMSMRAATKSAFDPEAADLGFFFSQSMMSSAAQRPAHA